MRAKGQLGSIRNPALPSNNLTLVLVQLLPGGVLFERQDIILEFLHVLLLLRGQFDAQGILQRLE